MRERKDRKKEEKGRGKEGRGEGEGVEFPIGLMGDKITDGKEGGDFHLRMRFAAQYCQL